MTRSGNMGLAKGKRVACGRPILLSLLLSALSALPFAATTQAAPARQHDTRLILLGTKGGPTADVQRSEPANLLLVDGRPYLIDAGAGTARQLAAVHYPPPAIGTIFITHHHLDHTAGLEPLMALNWIGVGLSGKAVPPVQIHGPPATRFLVEAAENYISVSERIFRAGIPKLPTVASRFVAHDITDDGPAYRDDLVSVTAAENTHFSHASNGPDTPRDKSLSYRFETPSGSIVFTGDTGPSDAVVALAKGADVLVSEVFQPDPSLPSGRPAGGDALRQQLNEHMMREHLTPQEVGKLATRAGVKTVILTHIVAADSPALAEQLKAGVHEYFKGNVIVGHDLLSFDLGKRQVEN